MATDYDKIYRDARHALGEPAKEFLAFFGAYDVDSAKVLDVGCGQGRDALFIARLGHRVTAVDISPSGIGDLAADAEAEGLDIKAVVADIRSYRPEELYDVVVIDRTLHMLQEEERIAVLRHLVPQVAPKGYVLIADEKSNIAGIESAFTVSTSKWTPILKRRGYLILRREQ